MIHLMEKARINYRAIVISSREFIYAIIIVSLCVESVYAEQILNLPQAVRDSCAIVRGRPVYLGEASFYNKKEGYEFSSNAVWSIDIVDVYRWSLSGWSAKGQLHLPGNAIPRQFIDVPRRLIYVVPGVSAILEYNEVVIFLKCSCSGGYIFTKIGWPLNIVEDEWKGEKRKFINGWSITGFREKKVSLEDFAMAIKKEEKRGKPTGSLEPAFIIID